MKFLSKAFFVKQMRRELFIGFFFLAWLVPCFDSFGAEPQVLYGLTVSGELVRIDVNPNTTSPAYVGAVLRRSMSDAVLNGNFLSLEYFLGAFYASNQKIPPVAGDFSKIVRFGFDKFDQTFPSTTAYYWMQGMGANTSGQLWASFSSTPDSPFSAHTDLVGQIDPTIGQVISSTIVAVQNNSQVNNITALAFDDLKWLYFLQNDNSIGSHFIAQLNLGDGSWAPKCAGNPCWSPLPSSLSGAAYDNSTGNIYVSHSTVVGSTPYTGISKLIFGVNPPGVSTVLLALVGGSTITGLTYGPSEQLYLPGFVGSMTPFL